MKRNLILVLVVAMIQLVFVSSSFADPIHNVAKHGDLTEVTRLTGLDLENHDADINAADTDGITPLHCAAIKGQTETAQALLARGADVNIANREGETPLHYAAEYGRIAIVQALLARGANPDAVDRFGETPLHSAVSYGRVEIVQALLASGADIHAVDQFGGTPLQWAKQKGYADIAAALHTAIAVAYSGAGNHTLAALSYTWAAEAVPGTPAAALSQKRAAESHIQAADEYRLAGRLPEAARSYAWAGVAYDAAGNHTRATQNYIWVAESVLGSLAVVSSGISLASDELQDEN